MIENLAQYRMETDSGMPLWVSVCKTDKNFKAIDIRLYMKADDGHIPGAERPTKKGIFLFLSLGKLTQLIELLEKAKEKL